MQINNNSGNQETPLYVDLIEMGRVVFVGFGGGRGALVENVTIHRAGVREVS
jgi:hypothetical protein